MCGCQVQKKIPWLLAEVLKDWSSPVRAAYSSYCGIALMLVSLQQASSKNILVLALLLVEPIMVSVHTLGGLLAVYKVVQSIALVFKHLCIVWVIT